MASGIHFFAVSILPCEILERDFICELEPETEMIRHLRTQSANPFFNREMVVARIRANRRKCARGFRVAFKVEFRLREFAPSQIP
ncbi:MAG: hypothetical protein ABIP20_02390, partial [Chthoniobacteraceae bacterium]